MASDVMSLFGLDPNVIQQQRAQGGVDQAARMDTDYAIGAAGGQMLGAGINSAFGLQTPEMAQAQQVQDSMQGQDLTTTAGMRAAASQLMQSGSYAQAMALYQRAADQERLDNKVPNVEGIKMYTLADGTSVQGAIVNGVPSYREGNKWVPLPDDASISKAEKQGKPATSGEINQVLDRMDEEDWLSNVFTADMTKTQQNVAAGWIAAKAKEYNLEMDWNEALDAAMREASTMVEKEGGFLGVGGDLVFKTSDESTTQWVVKVVGGKKWLVDPTGKDKTVKPYTGE